MIARLGAHPAGVWVVKHVVSPLDRLVVRLSGGRLPPLSRIAVPTLLLTTVGRRSGRQRTTPLVYIRDGDRFVVANARPAGERRNPWIMNLRASGEARIRVGGRTITVRAHELDDQQIRRWWPALTAAWPAFAQHYAATGERTVFVLHPVDESQGTNGPTGTGVSTASDPPRRAGAERAAVVRTIVSYEPCRSTLRGAAPRRTVVPGWGRR